MSGAPPLAAVILPPAEAFSDHAAGTVGRFVHRLARHAAGFRPLVIGPPHPAPFPDVAFRPLATAWPALGGVRRRAAELARLLAALRPAVIEVHDQPDLAVRLATRLRPVPVIVLLHHDPQRLAGAEDAAARTYLLAQATRVATLSAHLRARLLDGVHPSMRTATVLPDCLDLATLPQPARARRQTILFAGPLDEAGGADRFVQACALALPCLPGWQAEMIGPDRPDTGFLRTLRPLAEAAGVAIAGWRPHAQVLAAMAQAGIVAAVPRRPPGFGHVALEAMAGGAPLLHHPHPALVELVGDAGLAVAADDPSALAAALIALGSDPGRRAALSLAGLARARAFDAPAIAARLDALRQAAVDAWSRPTSLPI